MTISECKEPGPVQSLRDDDELVASIFDDFVSGLGRDDPSEVRAAALSLSETTRVRLAWFCYTRPHLGEIAEEIVATCDAISLLRAQPALN